MHGDTINVVVGLKFRGIHYCKAWSIGRHDVDEPLPYREIEYAAVRRIREAVMDAEYNEKLGRFAPWRNALT